MVHDSWVRTGSYLLSTVFLLEYFGDWQRLTYARRIDDPVLKVGEELWEESMRLRGGSRIYKLEGLKPCTRYEVKISYPASIPAYFSVQLLKRDAEFGASSNRKLLNTEKLIFRTDGLESLQNQGTMQVMVTVEPEGIVAIREVNERQSIIFNIVCDELLMGMIPLKAWWVVGCILLCLVVAFIIPSFLLTFLLPKSPTPDSLYGDVSKRSYLDTFFARVCEYLQFSLTPFCLVDQWSFFVIGSSLLFSNFLFSSLAMNSDVMAIYIFWLYGGSVQTGLCSTSEKICSLFNNNKIK